jgi:hypothetical protein
MKKRNSLVLFAIFLTLGGFMVKGIQGEGLAKEPALTPEEIGYLERIEKATFRGFEKLIDRATGLPVDIASVNSGEVVKLPKNPYYSKTSPTNIGLGFLYLALAKERGCLAEIEAYERALQMMDTLEKLEAHEGFLYNWYYLSGEKSKVPQVTQDRFISSLDNGDLDISLMAVSGAFPNTKLSQRIESYLGKKDYHFFLGKNPFHPGNGMISVGYDEAKRIYHSADYSIFNIEGRMTVLLAILKDGIPDTAWKKQSRLVKTYTTLEGEKIPVVAPWGGSLYEALFADEILGGFRVAPKAFLVNALHLIRIHQDKGKRISGSAIWGFSNGEIPAQDRYEMAGVPEIAYNRFPGEFVTPYSSFLALRYAPKEVIQNFKRMEALNPKAFNPRYGFTDSVDPKTGVGNRNILSLDKGMELLSIANFMNGIKGKKEVPDYLWSYWKEKGWDERAEALLKGEEEHPSFQALFKVSVDDSVSLPQEVSPIDLMEVRQNLGVFYEPGRAQASFKLSDSSDGRQIIEAQYDVTQRYSYSGIYLKFDDLEISDYRTLAIEFRGNPGKGFPKTLKVELKRRGEYVAFDHLRAGPDWSEARIALPGGEKKADELALVFENNAAGEHPKGEVLICSLILSE